MGSNKEWNNKCRIASVSEASMGGTGYVSVASDSSKASYNELLKEVRMVVEKSTFWERFGIDNLIIWSILACTPFAFWLIASDSWVPFCTGTLLLGCIHGMVTTKAGHAAAHGALSPNRQWNNFLARFFVEFCGCYSIAKGLEIHINIHHPHTNIVGLGDSSSWKAPYLPRHIYMFLAPLSIPIITPLVAVSQLWGEWKKLICFVILAATGIILNILILTHYCNLAFGSAVFTLWAARAVTSLPYIHINIFQHLGLNMFSNDNRPRRLELMSHGCLNLNRNPFFDLIFGHTLFHCHVEHHLFPRLSDNMCLKIKPLVKRYLKKNNLPYYEDSYWNRLKLFVQRYQELMVDPPPITKFVGIQ